MARFLRLDVLNKMVELGLVPVFYHGDLEVAIKIAAACANGGAKVVEFTNRGDFAYQVFGELVKHFAKADPEMILGAGSVCDPGTAALYINNGANFIVGPVFNPDVAKICNRRKVAYIPGCMTPTEISNAEEMGVDIVKVFPGKTVGPSFIKAVLGPCPWSNLMPSGGVEVTQENITDWIKSGASALNIGSNLIKKDLVKVNDYNGIKKLVEQCIIWINEARGKTH